MPGKEKPLDSSVVASRKRKVRSILQKLAPLHPDAQCALDFETPIQLLVATILSAQCTDVRVNMVTPALFARYPKPHDYANAKLTELEGYIKSLGFFRNKAKHIVAASQIIVERHDGEVPGRMEDLVELPGVGRKVANVVLTEGFEVPGITVDTHLARLTRRLGLTDNKNPNKIERDLMQVIPKKRWREFNHLIIFHGRRVCHAQKPRCEICPLARLCPKIDVPQPKQKQSPSSPQPNKAAVKKNP
ncbi:MAG: endonuclease III [Gemmataceae bacterium]